jgi:dCTP deaminase
LSSKKYKIQPGLIPDKGIRKLVEEYNMIEPFEEKLIDNGLISYGLSSYGYDARLAPEFKVFKPHKDFYIDPKNIRPELIEEVSGVGQYLIPAHGFILARTYEYFRIPKNVLSICISKSTYARCGLIVNVTPLEPGTTGQITLELSNTTDSPVKLYTMEGICQFLFFHNDDCEIDYSMRNGKYKDQLGVTLPRILGQKD